MEQNETSNWIDELNSEIDIHHVNKSFQLSEYSIHQLCTTHNNNNNYKRKREIKEKISLDQSKFEKDNCKNWENKEDFKQDVLLKKYSKHDEDFFRLSFNQCDNFIIEKEENVNQEEEEEDLYQYQQEWEEYEIDYDTENEKTEDESINDQNEPDFEEEIHFKEKISSDIQDGWKEKYEDALQLIQKNQLIELIRWMDLYCEDAKQKNQFGAYLKTIRSVKLLKKLSLQMFVYLWLNFGSFFIDLTFLSLFFQVIIKDAGTCLPSYYFKPVPLVNSKSLREKNQPKKELELEELEKLLFVDQEEKNETDSSWMDTDGFLVLFYACIEKDMDLSSFSFQSVVEMEDPTFEIKENGHIVLLPPALKMLRNLSIEEHPRQRMDEWKNKSNQQHFFHLFACFVALLFIDPKNSKPASNLASLVSNQERKSTILQNKNFLALELDLEFTRENRLSFSCYDIALNTRRDYRFGVLFYLFPISSKQLFTKNSLFHQIIQCPIQSIQLFIKEIDRICRNFADFHPERSIDFSCPQDESIFRIIYKIKFNHPLDKMIAISDESKKNGILKIKLLSSLGYRFNSIHLKISILIDDVILFLYLKDQIGNQNWNPQEFWQFIHRSSLKISQPFKTLIYSYL